MLTIHASDQGVATSYLLERSPQKPLSVGDHAIHLTAPFADAREKNSDGSGRDTQIPFGHVVEVVDTSENTPAHSIWWSKVKRGDGPDCAYVENHRLDVVNSTLLHDLRSTAISPYVWGRIEIEPVSVPEHLQGFDKMVLGLGCRLPLYGLDDTGTFLGRDGLYKIRKSLTDGEPLPIGNLNKTAANFNRVIDAATGGSFGYGGIDIASADCSGLFIATNCIFDTTQLPHGSAALLKHLRNSGAPEIQWKEARTGDAVFISKGTSAPDKVGFVYQLSVRDGHRYAFRSKQNVGPEIPLPDGRLASLGEDREVLAVVSMGFRD